MDAVLHRIEALPGASRYAVTFRIDDGSEQTTVMDVDGSDVQVAEASLPPGWTRTSDSFRSCAAAVVAMDVARRSVTGGAALQDVDGGWDVMLGNVVLTGAGPACTAHGAMTDLGGRWSCPECGAQAVLG